MRREIEFILRLGPGDRYRHRHIRVRGRVVWFRVQYETMLKAEWHPVVRYDTTHRFAHRDLIGKGGRVIKTPLFMSDFNDALTFAESDLRSNWEIYKERFLKEQGT